MTLCSDPEDCGKTSQRGLFALLGLEGPGTGEEDDEEEEGELGRGDSVPSSIALALSLDLKHARKAFSCLFLNRNVLGNPLLGAPLPFPFGISNISLSHLQLSTEMSKSNCLSTSKDQHYGLGGDSGGKTQTSLIWQCLPLYFSTGFQEQTLSDCRTTCKNTTNQPSLREPGSACPNLLWQTLSGSSLKKTETHKHPQ